MTSLKTQRSQDNAVGHSQCSLSSLATDANLRAVKCDGVVDFDLEATLSQDLSSRFSDAPVLIKEDNSGASAMLPRSNKIFDGCVADDSQTEDNDLYLSDCRISLVGFDVLEMRKLVSMVRRGGGSRYMSFNEKLTHIVVGSPSEM